MDKRDRESSNFSGSNHNFQSSHKVPYSSPSHTQEEKPHCETGAEPCAALSTKVYPWHGLSWWLQGASWSLHPRQVNYERTNMGLSAFTKTLLVARTRTGRCSFMQGSTVRFYSQFSVNCITKNTSEDILKREAVDWHGTSYIYVSLLPSNENCLVRSN